MRKTLATMSLQVGLGDSQEDWDVRGEIDFDFFEGKSSCSTESECQQRTSSGRQKSPPIRKVMRMKSTDHGVTDDNSTATSDGKPKFLKPIITVSRVNRGTDNTVPKTVIETVIPSPFQCSNIDVASGSSKSTYKKGSSMAVKAGTAQQGLPKGVVGEDSSEELSASSISDTDVTSSSSEEDSFENPNESDSMTDVSPLPSPYNCDTPDTPQDQSGTNLRVKSHPLKYGFHNTRCKCQYGKASVEALLEAVKRLELAQNSHESSLRKETPVSTSRSKHKKNMSFSNEQVRQIDHENQRLLKRILVQQHRPKTRSVTPTLNLPSSAINRQKQQRQIELENLAFLKRLESAKPSRNLCRSYLLKDYEKRTSSRSSTRPSSATSLSTMSSRSGTSSRCTSQSSAQKVSPIKKSIPDSHIALNTKKTKVPRIS